MAQAIAGSGIVDIIAKVHWKPERQARRYIEGMSAGVVQVTGGCVHEERYPAANTFVATIDPADLVLKKDG